MTTKHTPGPWEVENDGYYPVVRKKFRADHHMDICVSVHGYMYSSNEKENQMANARLIAAAPDLLVALQKVMANNVPLTGDPSHAEQVEFWQDEKAEGRGDADDMLAALAAIAKATGAA